MCKNTKWSELQNDKDFGLIVNSAVRYSIGRNTYMPGVIFDFVTKYISILDNRTLDCIISDITREIEFADGKLPQIELWLELKKTVETEIERRNIIEPLGKEKFNVIKVKTTEIEEVTGMSNLGMAVELKGIAIGREQGKIEGIDIGRKQAKEELLLEHIRNVMESTKWSAQQVMDAMKIPKSEQAHYAAMLDTDNKETLDALKEVEDMKKHPEKYKGFSSVDELISDLNDKNTKE